MTEQTFLQFRAGVSQFGLPVTQVVEIIRIAAFAPVPDPSPDLLGMINLRGRVIPVFDLCRTLQMGDRPLSLRMYIIIAEVEREAVGILVDDVIDVVGVPSESFQTSRALAGGATFTLGVARVGSRMLTVIDLHPLLDRTPQDAQAYHQ
ncbi:MAG TPA: chemotaxis protein CheW [Blastocatellia bacterium]|nr:chemotaxis protein CheW [Blastocatellia bacterium]